jgi:hypothetical protein
MASVRWDRYGFPGDGDDEGDAVAASTAPAVEEETKGDLPRGGEPTKGSADPTDAVVYFPIHRLTTDLPPVDTGHDAHPAAGAASHAAASHAAWSESPNLGRCPRTASPKLEPTQVPSATGSAADTCSSGDSGVGKSPVEFLQCPSPQPSPLPSPLLSPQPSPQPLPQPTSQPSPQPSSQPLPQPSFQPSPSPPMQCAAPITFIDVGDPVHSPPPRCVLNEAAISLYGANSSV